MLRLCSRMCNESNILIMTVLVVDNKRFLINTDSKFADETCEMIIDQHSADAVVYFDNVKKSDLIWKQR